jgi:hypothetical protein
MGTSVCPHFVRVTLMLFTAKQWLRSAGKRSAKQSSSWHTSNQKDVLRPLPSCTVVIAR